MHVVKLWDRVRNMVLGVNDLVGVFIDALQDLVAFFGWLDDQVGVCSLRTLTIDTFCHGGVDEHVLKNQRSLRRKTVDDGELVDRIRVQMRAVHAAGLNAVLVLDGRLHLLGDVEADQGEGEVLQETAL